jgi:hypothetical protein
MDAFFKISLQRKELGDRSYHRNETQQYKVALAAMLPVYMNLSTLWLSKL